MREDVDAAVNPCSQFFELEVKAMIMAAAMQVVGMENVNDKPTGEFLQPDLPNAGNTSGRLHLKLLEERRLKPSLTVF